MGLRVGTSAGTTVGDCVEDCVGTCVGTSVDSKPVSDGLHWEYHSLFRSHADPCSQQVGPFQELPPHFPQTSAQLSVRATDVMDPPVIDVGICASTGVSNSGIGSDSASDSGSASGSVSGSASGSELSSTFVCGSDSGSDSASVSGSASGSGAASASVSGLDSGSDSGSDSASGSASDAVATRVWATYLDFGLPHTGHIHVSGRSSKATPPPSLTVS